MFAWITGLPWPSLKEVFGSMVLFIILYPFRLFIQALYTKYMPDERQLRNFIIHQHFINRHELPLKHCNRGDCYRLTSAVSSGQSAALAAAEEQV